MIYIAAASARSYYALPRESMRLIVDEMDQPQVRVQELAPSWQRAFKPSRQAWLARETLPVTSTANAGGMA